MKVSNAYKKDRIKFRKDLWKMMKGNRALLPLIDSIYLMRKQNMELKKLEIMAIEQFNDKEDAFNVTNFLCDHNVLDGNDLFYPNFEYVDPEFVSKYENIIPDYLAISDSWAVAVAFEEEQKKRNAEQKTEN